MSTGKVETILQAVATGQAQLSGAGGGAEGDCSPRRSSCGSGSTTRTLRDVPAGSHRHGGDLHRPRQGRHVIRKVLLRQIAILNYVNPF